MKPLYNKKKKKKKSLPLPPSSILLTRTPPPAKFEVRRSLPTSGCILLYISEGPQPWNESIVVGIASGGEADRKQHWLLSSVKTTKQRVSFCSYASEREAAHFVFFSPLILFCSPRSEGWRTHSGFLLFPTINFSGFLFLKTALPCYSVAKGTEISQ